MNIYEQFARNIELFFENKCRCYVNNSEIIYPLDWQSSYVCDLKKRKIYYKERAYYDELPIMDDRYFEVEFLRTIFLSKNESLYDDREILNRISSINSLSSLSEYLEK